MLPLAAPAPSPNPNPNPNPNPSPSPNPNLSVCAQAACTRRGHQRDGERAADDEQVEAQPERLRDLWARERLARRWARRWRRRRWQCEPPKPPDEQRRRGQHGGPCILGRLHVLLLNTGSSECDKTCFASCSSTHDCCTARGGGKMGLKFARAPYFRDSLTPKRYQAQAQPRSTDNRSTYTKPLIAAGNFYRSTSRLEPVVVAILQRHTVAHHYTRV